MTFLEDPFQIFDRASLPFFIISYAHIFQLRFQQIPGRYWADDVTLFAVYDQKAQSAAGEDGTKNPEFFKIGYFFFGKVERLDPISVCFVKFDSKSLIPPNRPISTTGEICTPVCRPTPAQLCRVQDGRASFAHW